MSSAKALRALDDIAAAGADFGKKVDVLKGLDNVADIGDVMRQIDFGTIFKAIPSRNLGNIVENIPSKQLGMIFDQFEPRTLSDILDNLPTSAIKKLDNANPNILKKLDGIDIPQSLSKKIDDIPKSSTFDKVKGAITSGTSKKLAASAVLVGGAMYIDKKLKDESEDEQQCAGYCLPENWDETEASGFGTLGNDQIKYTTLESIKEANDGKMPKAPGSLEWDEVPICNENIENCGEYCIAQCKEKIDSGIPGSGIVNKAVDTVTDTIDGVFDKLGLSDLGKYLKWGIIGIIIVIFLFILFKLLSKK